MPNFLHAWQHGEGCSHLDRQTAHAPSLCPSMPAEDAVFPRLASIHCSAIHPVNISASTHLMGSRHELCRSSGPSSASMPPERQSCFQRQYKPTACSQDISIPLCAGGVPALGRMAALAISQQTSQPDHETCKNTANRGKDKVPPEMQS